MKKEMEIKLNNVCAFGDSVMKGIVADRDNSTGRGLKYRISEMGFAERCRRSLNIEVDNFARFGGIVSQGTKLVERYKEKIRNSDFVLFEFGGNDCSETKITTESEISLTPIPARCLVPRSLSNFFVVSGRKQPAATIRPSLSMAAPSCSGAFG